MSLTRSGTDLGVLLEALQSFSDGSVAHHMATEMAVDAQKLLRATFAESKAPDGRRWLPLKKPRPGGRVQLVCERYNGVFKIKKASHSFDTMGGDWYSDYESIQDPTTGVS